MLHCMTSPLRLVCSTPGTRRWSGGLKSVGLGQDRGKAPTIQSPRDYCKRFRGAMAGYFTCVPAEGDVPAPLDVAADLTE